MLIKSFGTGMVSFNHKWIETRLLSAKFNVQVASWLAEWCKRWDLVNEEILGKPQNWMQETEVRQPLHFPWKALLHSILIFFDRLYIKTYLCKGKALLGDWILQDWLIFVKINLFPISSSLCFCWKFKVFKFVPSIFWQVVCKDLSI